MLRHFLLAVSFVLIWTSTSSAHYLWFLVRSQDNGGRTANLYFEEGPGPRDGKYLDPFVMNGQFWIRTPDDSKATSLKMTEIEKGKKRWMVSQENVPSPCAVEAYGKWGVYPYGKTNILLHYNARHLDVKSGAQLEKLARAKHLTLDIVPSISKKGIHLQVLWKGKPAANRPFYVRGGFNGKLETDDNGQVTVPLSKTGLYTFRSYIELNEKGADNNGKDYSKIRHHCTLTMKLPLERD